MTSNKKSIAVKTIAIVAMMFLGNAVAYASEVTGTLSASSTGSSNSQSGGTVGGTVTGGSNVSGSIGGGAGGGTVSGIVSGGGNGGGGGGGEIVLFPNTGSGSGNSVAVGPFTPGLPNTGAPGSDNPAAWTYGIVALLTIILLALWGTFYSSIKKRYRN